MTKVRLNNSFSHPIRLVQWDERSKPNQTNHFNTPRWDSKKVEKRPYSPKGGHWLNTLYGASLSLAQEVNSSKVRAGLDSISRFLLVSASGTIIAQTTSPYALSGKPSTQHSDTAEFCTQVAPDCEYHNHLSRAIFSHSLHKGSVLVTTTVPHNGKKVIGNYLPPI